MNRKDFIKNVADVLRDNEAKKPVSIPKQVFHISDDEGNSKDFTVKKIDKRVMFTQSDVATIVDACICVITDSLRRGEPVTFHGLGTLGLSYRSPRKTTVVNIGQEILVDGHYAPKFSFGKDLRMCAKVYELSLRDRLDEPEPRYDESDEVNEEVLASYGN